MSADVQARFGVSATIASVLTERWPAVRFRPWLRDLVRGAPRWEVLWVEGPSRAEAKAALADVALPDGCPPPEAGVQLRRIDRPFVRNDLHRLADGLEAVFPGATFGFSSRPSVEGRVTWWIHWLGAPHDGGAVSAALGALARRCYGCGPEAGVVVDRGGIWSINQEYVRVGPHLSSAHRGRWFAGDPGIPVDALGMSCPRCGLMALWDLVRRCWRACGRPGCGARTYHLDEFHCPACGDQMPVVCGADGEAVSWLALESLRRLTFRGGE